MLIFAADHEPDRLQALHQAIAEASPETKIRDFLQFSEALNAAEEQEGLPDAVFTGMGMQETDGLAFAKQMKLLAPATYFVLLADTEAYAAKAYALHVDGYILRPYSTERIRDEMEFFYSRKLQENRNASTELFNMTGESERIQVRCFGCFAAFWKKKPLVFGRKKTTELLAYLVDRRGAPCSAEEAIDVLYEKHSEPDDIKNAKQNLRNLVFDLTSVLKQIGQENILVRTRNTIAICPDQIDCDYYGLLEGKKKNRNEFTGEYMEQFSWAETTKGRIIFQISRDNESLPNSAIPEGDWL